MQKYGIVITDITDINKLDTSKIDYIKLSDHGFTPSLEMYETIKAHYNVPIYCVIEHQAKYYNQETIEAMCDSAKTLIANGADGLVCDFMNSDYSINYLLVSKLRRYVKDKALIYELTLDDKCDELRALQELIVIEVEKVIFKGNLKQYLRRIAKVYFEYNEVIDMILEANDYNTLVEASEFTNINNVLYNKETPK